MGQSTTRGDSFKVADDKAVTIGHRLKIVDDSGVATVEHAGATDLWIGIAQSTIELASVYDSDAGIAAPRGRYCAARGINEGVVTFIAAGAISLGDQLGGAADGKVTVGTNMQFQCISNNVAADGDECVAIPLATGIAAMV